MNEETIAKIREHYEHAKAKHPYFCDMLNPNIDQTHLIMSVNTKLTKIRNSIAEDIKDRDLIWDTLLNCEVWEVHEAIANDDTDHAVKECYDAIAVLLRVVDVLEGRQKLGKPEARVMCKHDSTRKCVCCEGCPSTEGGAE